MENENKLKQTFNILASRRFSQNNIMNDLYIKKQYGAEKGICQILFDLLNELPKILEEQNTKDKKKSEDNEMKLNALDNILKDYGLLGNRSMQYINNVDKQAEILQIKSVLISAILLNRNINKQNFEQIKYFVQTKFDITIECEHMQNTRDNMNYLQKLAIKGKTRENEEEVEMQIIELTDIQHTLQYFNWINPIIINSITDTQLEYSITLEELETHKYFIKQLNILHDDVLEMLEKQLKSNTIVQKAFEKHKTILMNFFINEILNRYKDNRTIGIKLLTEVLISTKRIKDRDSIPEIKNGMDVVTTYGEKIIDTDKISTYIASLAGIKSGKYLSTAIKTIANIENGQYLDYCFKGIAKYKDVDLLNKHLFENEKYHYYLDVVFSYMVNDKFDINFVAQCADKVFKNENIDEHFKNPCLTFNKPS